MSSSKITIAYDREIFLMQKYGGISKYFSHIIGYLQMNSELKIDPILTFERTDNYHVRKILEDSTILKRARKYIRPSGGFSTSLTYGPVHSLSARWAGGRTSSLTYNTLHATYYRPTIFETGRNKKIFVTVHDFIPEKLGWSGMRNPHIGKRRLVEKADLIFCVSKSTANDLSEYFGISGDRVVIAHHGVEMATEVDLVESLIELNRPNVLYVGHRAGYKNFSILPKALNIIARKIPELMLTIAGPELKLEEIEMLNKYLGEGNWEFFLNPTEFELNQLYKKAKLHCVTSLFEGFGLTILESMTFGKPVILSNIEVFREVAGDHATYFNPNSVEDLANCLELHLSTKCDVQSQLKIVNHAKTFSWKKSAEIHANAYLR